VTDLPAVLQERVVEDDLVRRRRPRLTEVGVVERAELDVELQGRRAVVAPTPESSEPAMADPWTSTEAPTSAVPIAAIRTRPCIWGSSDSIRPGPPPGNLLRGGEAVKTR
jgi:hypothetical protein